jgi:predicted flap endonuclease-1-like 5' DNA nuclease
MAVSLEDLVSQIDAKSGSPDKKTGGDEPPPVPPPETIDESESTVAVSLADLVGAIDGADDGPAVLNVKPAPEGASDDLKEIRGIGPATEKRLNGAGIVTWSQMASLTEDDLAAVADLLKVSVDKINREQWVEQAIALADK